MWKKNKHDTQYISDPPSGEIPAPKHLDKNWAPLQILSF